MINFNPIFIQIFDHMVYEWPLLDVKQREQAARDVVGQVEGDNEGLRSRIRKMSQSVLQRSSSIASASTVQPSPGQNRIRLESIKSVSDEVSIEIDNKDFCEIEIAKL